LSAKALKDKTPLFQFPISANPSNQPRLGLGASLSALISILVTLNVLPKSTIKELSTSAKKLAKNSKNLSGSSSPARSLAKKIKGKEILIITGPLLAGNAHTLRNQFNESAKQHASYLTVSDMNHHALEGLSFPRSNRKRLTALFIDSALDDKKIQKRMEVDNLALQ
jgi:GMP synthase PP-ATPase subunit